ncbi:DinB family protein [Cellulophaga baltica]|uniref:DinB family protein n=1 Tax=Cellulophaga TaxID=104264 RepID=UPI001C06B28D|nr:MULTISPECIES: DinB family protein [Cellulophaga]MBU2996184.1 DinB family protein [Cellulophaga baltica]MDO6767579.1 DinB family protein [Cellulophaga sp. 1_MG-2023]
MNSTELQPEDYNAYYETYISKLNNVELVSSLHDDLTVFVDYVKKIPTDKWGYAYEVNKWSVAEVLLHIIDTERVFQYRALCFSRGDKSHFPGFDQDAYVIGSNAESRSKESILNEFIAVRNATITLFSSFSEQDLIKKGVASNSPMSVAAAGFVISGHLKHHFNILEERYF